MFKTPQELCKVIDLDLFNKVKSAMENYNDEKTIIEITCADMYDDAGKKQIIDELIAAKWQRVNGYSSLMIASANSEITESKVLALNSIRRSWEVDVSDADNNTKRDN
jgi:hypothetical protein